MKIFIISFCTLILCIQLSNATKISWMCPQNPSSLENNYLISNTNESILLMSSGTLPPLGNQGLQMNAKYESDSVSCIYSSNGILYLRLATSNNSILGDNCQLNHIDSEGTGVTCTNRQGQNCSLDCNIPEYIAVGEKGSIYIESTKYSNSPQPWIKSSIPNQNLNFTGIASRKSGSYVATGNEQSNQNIYGKVFTSHDGINWINKVILTNFNFNFITFINGNFITITTNLNRANGYTLFKSAYGDLWTTSRVQISNSTAQYEFMQIVPCDHNYFALAFNYNTNNNDILFSSNLINWSVTPSQGPVNALAYNPNSKIVLAIPDKGFPQGFPIICGAKNKSSLGKYYGPPSDIRFNDIVYAESQFTTVGDTGAIFYSNNNGSYWNSRSLYTPEKFSKIIYDQGQYSIMGMNFIYTSSDLVNWMSGNGLEDANLKAITSLFSGYQ